MVYLQALGLADGFYSTAYTKPKDKKKSYKNINLKNVFIIYNAYFCLMICTYVYSYVTCITYLVSKS